MSEKAIKFDFTKVLTVEQVIEFVEDVVNSVYIKDEDGNIVGVSINAKQFAIISNVVKFFSDFDGDYKNLDEYYTKVANFDFYKDMSKQANDILNTIDDKLAYIQTQINNERADKITFLLTEILETQLENEKKQREVIDAMEETYKGYDKNEIMRITDVFSKLNENMQSKEVISEVVKTVKEISAKDNLQDHKKSAKKTTKKKTEKVVDITTSQETDSKTE